MTVITNRSCILNKYIINWNFKHIYLVFATIFLRLLCALMYKYSSRVAIM